MKDLAVQVVAGKDLIPVCFAAGLELENPETAASAERASLVASVHVGQENLAATASVVQENLVAAASAGQMGNPATEQMDELGTPVADGLEILEQETLGSAGQESFAASSAAGRLAEVGLVIPEKETGKVDAEVAAQNLLLVAVATVAVVVTELGEDDPVATVVPVDLELAPFVEETPVVAFASVAEAVGVAIAVLHFAAVVAAESVGVTHESEIALG